MALFARSIDSFYASEGKRLGAGAPQGHGVAGFQLQRSAKAGIRGLPVKVVAVVNPAQRQMRVSELGIERQRLFRGLARTSKIDPRPVLNRCWPAVYMPPTGPPTRVRNPDRAQLTAGIARLHARGPSGRAARRRNAPARRGCRPPDPPAGNASRTSSRAASASAP